jgi:hypothetical protein
MTAFQCLLAIAVPAYLLGFWWVQRQRENEIKDLAARLSFHYLGPSLPRSLTLNGTEIARATSFWNVIDGELNGVRVVAFDCRIGEGKGSWRRTVIAAKTPSDIFRMAISEPFQPVLSVPNLAIDRSGDWAILYYSKSWSNVSPRLMPIQELETRLRSIP